MFDPPPLPQLYWTSLLPQLILHLVNKYHIKIKMVNLNRYRNLCFLQLRKKEMYFFVEFDPNIEDLNDKQEFVVWLLI